MANAALQTFFSPKPVRVVTDSIKYAIKNINIKILLPY